LKVSFTQSFLQLFRTCYAIGFGKSNIRLLLCVGFPPLFFCQLPLLFNGKPNGTGVQNPSFFLLLRLQLTVINCLKVALQGFRIIFYYYAVFTPFSLPFQPAAGLSRTSMHCVNFVFIPGVESGGKPRVTTIFYGCSQIFRPASNNFPSTQRVIAKVFPLRCAVFKLFRWGIFKLQQ